LYQCDDLVATQVLFDLFLIIFLFYFKYIIISLLGSLLSLTLSSLFFVRSTP
jgi:hypothetical protein